MQKGVLTAALYAVMASGAWAADPVEGVWKTAPQDDGGYGFIQIAPCGPAFCGTLIKGVNGAGEVATTGGDIGKLIIWDMTAQGDGLYGGGKIWAPDRDKTYNSKMQLTGDSLAVSGCVFGICRDGGTWVRAN
jgi:uncharacterized protein (DUF2147 family)